MDDTDEAGDPADAQHPQPVVPGVLLQAPALLLVVPPDEVDSLQDVRHRVTEADSQVEQEELEDDQPAEDGGKPRYRVYRVHGVAGVAIRPRP